MISFQDTQTLACLAVQFFLTRWDSLQSTIGGIFNKDANSTAKLFNYGSGHAHWLKLNEFERYPRNADKTEKSQTISEKLFKINRINISINFDSVYSQDNNTKTRYFSEVAELLFKTRA